MGETKYWTNGAATGNFQTAANWDTGNVPGSADTIIFDGRSQADVILGLTGNAFAVAAIIALPAYTGTIGDAAGANALTVQAITTLQWASSGPMARFALSGGTATATTVKLEHSGTVSLGAGTWGASGSAANPSLYNSLGTVQISSGAILDVSENVGGTMTVAGSAAGAGGTVTCSGGVLNWNDRTATVMNCNAGLVRSQGTSVITLGTVQAGAILQDLGSGTTAKVAVMPNGMYTLVGIPYATKTTTLALRRGAKATYMGIPGCAVTATVTGVGGAIGSYS